MRQPVQAGNGVFGAYVQPHAARNGVFGDVGDSPIMVNDGLIVLSSSGEQQWAAQWATSCMDAQPTPTSGQDLLFQLSATDCTTSVGDTHAPLNLLIPQFAQQGYIALVETTAFLTGAYYSRVLFTRNSETVRQLAGASAGVVQPGIGVYAVATQELNPVGVALITQARAVAKGISPAPGAPIVVASKASLLGKSSTALVAIGIVGLIVWAFGSKKKKRA